MEKRQQDLLNRKFYVKALFWLGLLFAAFLFVLVGSWGIAAIIVLGGVFFIHSVVEWSFHPEQAAIVSEAER